MPVLTPAQHSAARELGAAMGAVISEAVISAERGGVPMRFKKPPKESLAGTIATVLGRENRPDLRSLNPAQTRAFGAAVHAGFHATPTLAVAAEPSVGFSAAGLRRDLFNATAPRNTPLLSSGEVPASKFMETDGMLVEWMPKEPPKGRGSIGASASASAGPTKEDEAEALRAVLEDEEEEEEEEKGREEDEEEEGSGDSSGSSGSSVTVSDVSRDAFDSSGSGTGSSDSDSTNASGSTDSTNASGSTDSDEDVPIASLAPPRKRAVLEPLTDSSASAVAGAERESMDADDAEAAAAEEKSAASTLPPEWSPFGAGISPIQASPPGSVGPVATEAELQQNFPVGGDQSGTSSASVTQSTPSPAKDLRGDFSLIASSVETAASADGSSSGSFSDYSASSEAQLASLPQDLVERIQHASNYPPPSRLRFVQHAWLNAVGNEGLGHTGARFLMEHVVSLYDAAIDEQTRKGTHRSTLRAASLGAESTKFFNMAPWTMPTNDPALRRTVARMMTALRPTGSADGDSLSRSLQLSEPFAEGAAGEAELAQAANISYGGAMSAFNRSFDVSMREDESRISAEGAEMSSRSAANSLDAAGVLDGIEQIAPAGSGADAEFSDDDEGADGSGGVEDGAGVESAFGQGNAVGGGNGGGGGGGGGDGGGGGSSGGRAAKDPFKMIMGNQNQVDAQDVVRAQNNSLGERQGTQALYIPVHAEACRRFFSNTDYAELLKLFASAKVPKGVDKIAQSAGSLVEANASIAGELGEALGIQGLRFGAGSAPADVLRESIELNRLYLGYLRYTSSCAAEYAMATDEESALARFLMGDVPDRVTGRFAPPIERPMQPSAGEGGGDGGGGAGPEQTPGPESKDVPVNQTANMFNVDDVDDRTRVTFSHVRHPDAPASAPEYMDSRDAVTSIKHDSNRAQMQQGESAFPIFPVSRIAGELEVPNRPLTAASHGRLDHGNQNLYPSFKSQREVRMQGPNVFAATRLTKRTAPVEMYEDTALPRMKWRKM